MLIRASNCCRVFASLQNIYKVQRMKANIIDGKKLAAEVKEELKHKISLWTSTGHRPPQLTAVLVGSDPASTTYVKNKMVAAEYVGIQSKTLSFPSSISQDELLEEIENLNADPAVDSILVQLPLPEHISESDVCNAVKPEKDVDGFHIQNMGKLCLNMDTIVPCTALAVIEIIKRIGLDVFGKNVVVCGRSKHVGLPISMILHSDAKYSLPGLEATTTLCHRNTPPEQLEVFVRTADVVISATGVPNLIQPHMVKPGAVVIDVGISRISDKEGKTKLVGDVNYEGVANVASYITPVPGGVGPMTVAMLMKNTFKIAQSLAK